MNIKPLTLSQANDLVSRLHRHHKPVVGHRFSLGLETDAGLCGAVIVGRPVARSLPQYEVAEVTRLVTDGTKNACSALYAAAARVCKEMGFRYIQTYILADEPGTSLKAAGWIDPADFGRCYRLLKIMPSWRPRLPEVAALFPKWTGLVSAWDELTALYEEELPRRRCPKLYVRMQELRGEAVR